MSLFFSHPFLKFGFVCASALFVCTAIAVAQTETESFTLSQPTQQHSTTQTFELPDFNPNIGTLADVTLTLKIFHKTYTIFDLNNPSKDWVILDLDPPGSANTDGTEFADWSGSSLGGVEGTFKKTKKSIQSMGIAGLVLFDQPPQNADPYIKVNYTYDISNPNNPNGGGQATPEPAIKYLSAIAAGVMVLMLMGRSARRRAGIDAEPVLS
jgi:hypothetical protein